MNFPFNKVTSIGEYAFSYCSELKKVTMPNCTYVGNNAFHSDHNLVEVTFSDECTFGTNCFSGCCSLRPKPDGTL